MMDTNLSSPDEMKALIESQLVQEGYVSAGEYLRSLTAMPGAEGVAGTRGDVPGGPGGRPSDSNCGIEWVALRKGILADSLPESIRP